MQADARGSAPSPGDRARDSLRSERLERNLDRAAPWKGALALAFLAEPDSVLREEAVRLIFLATYKHRLAAVGDSAGPAAAGKAAPPLDSARMRSEAEAFHKTWVRMKSASAKAGLPPLAMAEAIYKFTNSDWAPVGGARGPGLDRVETAKDYRAWVAALIPVGRKALAAGLDPAEVWSRQAASYAVREPKDLKSAPLQPPSPRF